MIPEFWLVIVVAIAGFIVQARLQSVFAKYSKVPFPQGMTGAQVAEKMLRENGVPNVRVTSTRGSLTDNFNPSNLTVNLSEPVYAANTISAGAVAAHESGHAVQHARGYAPMKLRAALVPVVTFSSRFAMWVVLAGLLVINTLPSLFWVGIGLLGVALLFSLVTLPVELNASRRALVWLKGTGMLNTQQQAQAKQALTWAAMTYVVAALSALTSIIYYIAIANRRR